MFRNFSGHPGTLPDMSRTCPGHFRNILRHSPRSVPDIFQDMSWNFQEFVWSSPEVYWNFQDFSWNSQEGSWSFQEVSWKFQELSWDSPQVSWDFQDASWISQDISGKFQEIVLDTSWDV